MSKFQHSYENEKEIVIAKEVFVDWCNDVAKKHAASMKNGNAGAGKPMFYFEPSTNTKTQLEKYTFEYNPDEFKNEGGHKVYTATATFYAKDGHKIVVHHNIQK